MPKIIEFETDRLFLRQWRKSDWPIFAALNADPEVMAYFPNLLSEAESNAFAQKIENLIAQRGWGLWAAEEKLTAQFIGFIGLHEAHPDLPFASCVEIGWRLQRTAWGKGYATEGAKKVLEIAFEQLQLPEVVSFTSVENQRSIAVMQRLNMTNTHQNFEHPAIAQGHRLREHVLYRIVF